MDFACKRNGRQPAADYLKKLERTDASKFFALIKTLADTGSLDVLRLNPVGDGISELKINGHRLLCFCDEGNWYLTNGCPKLKKREFQVEKQKALDIREQELQRRNRK